MNKKELVCAIAARTSLTGLEAGKAIEAFIAAVTEALKKGESVALAGLFTVKVIEKPVRDGIHPQTGAKIKLAAKKTVKIKAAASLEEEINK